MDNFFRPLAPRPSDYGGLPGKITREDDAGGMYDENGRLIFNRNSPVDAPETWVDTAVGVATAPAKFANALMGSLSPYGQDGWQVPPIISEPAAAFQRSGELTGFGDDGQFYLPNVQNPQVAGDTLTQLMTVYGGNALNPLARVPKGAVASGAVKQVANPVRAYRGVNSGEFFGPHPDSASVGGAVWSTSDPAIASEFAFSGGNPVSPAVYPVEMDFKNPLVVDAGGSLKNLDPWAEKARRMGHDGLIVERVRDTPDMRDYSDPQTVYAALQPGTVRSATTGETLFSDNRPSLMGSALASQAPESALDAAMAGVRRAVDNDLGDRSPFWNNPIPQQDLRLYHGTGATFDKFNTPDVWATPNPDMASQWANHMSVDGGAPNVLPLDIKNARITRPKSQLADAEAERARALAEGYDVIDWGNFDGANYYQAVRPGTVRSATTGETLFSDNRPSLMGSALASQADSLPMDQASIRGYHGTRSDFDKFDGPSYFSTHKPYADKFAGEAGRVIEADLSPSNPYWTNNQSFVESLRSFPDRVEELRAKGHDAAIFSSEPGNLDPILQLGGYSYPQIYMMEPGKVRSATTGEVLFSDNKPSLMGSALASQSSLPMDQASRLARAAEQGYDTSRTLYHGTNADFDAFRPSERGAYGPGVYVTPDADYANRYAIGRSGWEQDTRIMPLHVRGDLADGLLYESLKREARAAGVPEESIGAAVQQQLTDLGYTGVEGKANQAVTIFDPANIRSTNAAFDPARAGENGLLLSDNKPSLLGSALASGQGDARGITAYHGSPHDFDKFDMSKIGSGEGAQAYGHGLYFAENEGVAKSYRDVLAGAQNGFLDSGSGRSVVIEDPIGGEWRAARYQGSPGMLGRADLPTIGLDSKTFPSFDEALDHARRSGYIKDGNLEFTNYTDGYHRPVSRDEIGGLEYPTQIVARDPGHMYQVRINADPGDFLDWDVPLREQGQSIQNALMQAAQREAERLMASDRLQASKAEQMGMNWTPKPPIDPLSLRGADIWDRIPDQAGIPGIKYLDQQSRDAGAGSRNYVVFDDSLIEILKKYGWLAPGAMYGANSLADQGPPDQF